MNVEKPKKSKSEYNTLRRGIMNECVDLTILAKKIAMEDMQKSIKKEVVYYGCNKKDVYTIGTEWVVISPKTIKKIGYFKQNNIIRL